MAAFVVEDGTGLSSATSYVSVVEADSYIGSFVLDTTYWGSLSIADKEKRLMIASKWLDSSLVWESEKLNSDQGLEFPRLSFGFPDAIKESTILLANEIQNGSLAIARPVLKSQKYGNSEEVYASPYEEGSGVIRSVLLLLKRYGYGRSATTIIVVERA